LFLGGVKVNCFLYYHRGKEGFSQREGRIAFADKVEKENGVRMRMSAYVKKYVCVVEWSINCHIFCQIKN
jgi:hypothetical protein